MSKHTQGPWHVDFGLIASRSLSSTKRIAVLVDQKQDPIDFPAIDDGEFEEEFANARLIAAAPDLLRALQHAHVRALKARSYGVDMLSSKNLCLDDVISIVTEAIAKAEGL